VLESLLLSACAALADPSTASEARSILREAPSARSLEEWHDLLGQEPHVAGTPGDARQIERLRQAFAAMGLEVSVQEIHPLLARPVAASLEIVTLTAGPEGPSGERDGPAVPRKAAAAAQPEGAPEIARRTLRGGVLGLTLREENLVEDPATAHPDLAWGWNAYSASGDVTAPVVYANHATREDFALLQAMGVQVQGGIVLARYGRNFRGDKVRFAEEAGAVGVVLFSDPADVAKGPAWPEGGWANDTCVQRGSILKKAQPGDPLTPGVPSTVDAPRLTLDEANLPAIPVQPIGYGAAGRILAAMAGPPAPAAWQGGVEVTHRLTSGPGMALRLRVEQERLILPTANVVATLRGAGSAQESVVVGCHHDAWGFGAADPLAGTIVLMETAKAFAEASRAGWRPRRTIHFAAWGAEEFGIIGSTEWCEANADSLPRECVAYVNLDMAAMGGRLGAAGSPLLSAVILDAAREIPQAGDGSRAVADAWSATGSARPTIGLVGGGSDHEAFQFHHGIPTVGLFAGGGQGTSYHTNYDTLAWYRSVVGDDYEPALMVARMCTELTRRLADDPQPPLDGQALVGFLRQAVADVDGAAAQRCLLLPRLDLDAAIARLEQRLTDSGGPVWGPAAERTWLMPESVRWHRHALYGPHADAGYSVETLPALRAAIRTGSQAQLDAACGRFIELVDATGG
jgi:hypothetical protein